MIAVGKIVKPHGIRGDVKVENFMDSPVCFIKIKKVFVNSAEFKVEKAVIQKDNILLKLSGISDMTTAETLRNAMVFCQETDLPETEEDRFYISDIIGCTVFDEEQEYGKIIDVLQNGSADVIVLSDKQKKYMFPWLKSLNARVDIDAKLFKVDGKRLQEVIVDED